MHDQMDNLHAQHLKDQDEIDQLALLYKVSRKYTQNIAILNFFFHFFFKTMQISRLDQ